MLLVIVIDVIDVFFVIIVWFGKGLVGLVFLKVFIVFVKKENNVV